MVSALSNFHWIDALDILIVAFCIYQLLLIFRGTRAAQILVVLAVLYLASHAALQIGLLTVNWVLQNLLGAWVLLMIIIFQPELRRVLAGVGKMNFLRVFSRRGEAHMIDELARSAVSLASKRSGAIIVLERETKLDGYIEPGVNLDSLISRRLLESIFFSYSPLHDGAVIINNGRIVAASCFLPLSLSPEASRDFGTRHRAAIGITEETDAVVIVVSEETGTISVAHEGKIERDLDSLALRKRLGDILEIKG
ncbi:MAG: diadenylate cyclase CdaA [bacterium]